MTGHLFGTLHEVTFGSLTRKSVVGDGQSGLFFRSRLLYAVCFMYNGNILRHFALASHHGRALGKVGFGPPGHWCVQATYCFVQAEIKDAMTVQLQRDIENLKAEAFAVSLLPIVGSCGIKVGLDKTGLPQTSKLVAICCPWAFALHLLR